MRSRAATPKSKEIPLDRVRFDRAELIRKSRALRLANYAFELARCHKRLGVPYGRYGKLIQRYGEWSESVKSGRNPIELGIPWMVYDSLDHLKNCLRVGDLVFEYGSGGSTIFFARLGTRGVSIEHHEGWAKFVNSELASSVPDADWDVRFIPPNPASSDPDKRFLSSSPSYNDASFVDYVKSIESFPTDHFALVAVDGRARNSCARSASAHVAIGGLLLIDNTDREEYRAEIDHLVNQGWEAIEFNGPLPSTPAFGRTTVLRRPPI